MPREFSVCAQLPQRCLRPFQVRSRQIRRRTHRGSSNHPNRNHRKLGTFPKRRRASDRRREQIEARDAELIAKSKELADLVGFTTLAVILAIWERRVSSQPLEGEPVSLA